MTQRPAQVALGAAIRSLREDRGLSQEDLAHISNLHRTYVSQTERGERNVTLTTVLRLADALGVDGAELLRRAGV